jgi:hypothetical protein
MDVEVLGLEDLEVEVVVLDLVLAELRAGGRSEEEPGCESCEGEGCAARGDPPDDCARPSAGRS